MKRSVGCGILLVAFFVLILAIATSLPTLPPPIHDGARVVPDADRRAVGVLHVHSRYSDGAGDFREIAGAARRAGLDFVVITDHRDLTGLDREEEGYEEGVLRLVGAELSTEGGHLLALDTPSPSFRFANEPAETLRDIAELGGWTIVAHPFAERRHFAWSSWDLPGYHGLELFSLYASSVRLGLWRALVTTCAYPFAPRRALVGTLAWDPDALATWDRLLATRPVVGWAGLDAHGRVPLVGGVELTWGGYEAPFSLARNHLILREPLNGDVAHDRSVVYDALYEGRGYIAFDGLADGSSFRFVAEHRDTVWDVGSRVAFEEPKARDAVATLHASVTAPEGTRLLLLRDGELLATSDSGDLRRTVDRPGVYRVEARLPRRYTPGERDQPWIVSNPIYLLLPGGGRDAREPASFPEPPDLEGAVCESAPFAPHAELDAASSMDESAVRAEHGAVSRMVFRLGVPTAQHPYVWCSLADRSHRDWSGYEGLRFEVRSDDRYRVDLQIRDENPRASDEGTEWWATTFRTTTDWAAVDVPFERLESISPASDGSLDLDRLRGLFFVLDPGNTRPGVEGEIEIRNLELCRRK